MASARHANTCNVAPCAFATFSLVPVRRSLGTTEASRSRWQSLRATCSRAADDYHRVRRPVSLTR